MSRALRLTTRTQPGSSLMSSSLLSVAASSSLVGGGLPGPLLPIPQNQSRHRRSRLGAGDWTSGRSGNYRVSLKGVSFPSFPGHSLEPALPSITTACSWYPFCTGVGLCNSSASRSSRSSLLCRRLKTRRWSWEVREKGPGGSSALHPGCTLAHHCFPSPCPGLHACPGSAQDSSFQDSLCPHTGPQTLS